HRSAGSPGDGRVAARLQTQRSPAASSHGASRQEFQTLNRQHGAFVPGRGEAITTNVKRDYYEVLGLERTCADQEIKSAYRKLAMMYHPDRNPNNPDAEDKFKELTEAYAVLIDADKRSAYDRFGHAGVSGSGGMGGFDPSAFQDLSDIFGEFFGIGDLFGAAGGGRRRTRAQRGADLREDLTLTFEESVFGTETQVA